jgi:nucleoside-diphosphate-sugar epimerase
MGKLLITGSSGFVGSSLLPKLTSKFNVSALVIRMPKIKFKSVNYIIDNLFEEKKIENLLQKKNFKFLIHLAWEAKPKLFWNSDNNIKFLHASSNLYYYFCLYGGEFAILTGSSAECDLEKKLVKEHEVKKKFIKSKYEISKYLFMKNVQKISNIFKSNFAWARLFWIYGENQPRGKLISDIIFHIKNKKKFTIQNKFDKINIMHVKDVASALFALLNSRIKGIVNVASQKNFTIIQLISMIKNLEVNKKLVLKDNTRSYLFKKIVIKNLIRIGFKEKFNIKSDLNI